MTIFVFLQSDSNQWQVSVENSIKNEEKRRKLKH